MKLPCHEDVRADHACFDKIRNGERFPDLAWRGADDELGRRDEDGSLGFAVRGGSNTRGRSETVARTESRGVPVTRSVRTSSSGSMGLHRNSFAPRHPLGSSGEQVGRAAHGDHSHAREIGIATNLLDQLEPVHPRHHEIDQDDIGFSCVQGRDRIGTIGCLSDVKSFVAEVRPRSETS